MPRIPPGAEESPMDTNPAPIAALPPGGGERLATPTPAATTLVERLDSLLEGYALEIGAKALAGDIVGMNRAQRFHHQVTQLRDRWVSDSANPVRPTKAPPASAAAVAEVRA